jgi:hypothetical protein
MRATPTIVAGLALMATALVPLAASAQSSSIVGTWLVTSEDESHQRGAMIFTGTNYSIMLERADRPELGEEPTDADRLAAYTPFTANMGRYTMEGDQVTYEAYMAKNPNYQAGWPENARTVTVSVDGDMMTWTSPNGGSLMLRRVS